MNDAHRFLMKDRKTFRPSTKISMNDTIYGYSESVLGYGLKISTRFFAKESSRCVIKFLIWHEYTCYKLTFGRPVGQRFLNGIFDLCKQENSENESREFRIIRGMHGRYEHCKKHCFNPLRTSGQSTSALTVRLTVRAEVDLGTARGWQVASRWELALINPVKEA